jgi:DNA-binding NarL/FixJ family response regulator
MDRVSVRRVLLVDDHPAFAASARALLIHEGFDIVGIATSGEEALAMCDALLPEVLLLDVHLPGISGLDVADQLALAPDPPEMILISSDTDAGADPMVLAAPVRGFLPKRDLTCAAINALLG